MSGDEIQLLQALRQSLRVAGSRPKRPRITRDLVTDTLRERIADRDCGVKTDAHRSWR